MRQSLARSAIVTLLAVALYFFLATRVAAARGTFKVKHPATTGNADFERIFRAHINTLEWMPTFLIPLWLVSGALFPIAGASRWLRALMLANPLTYGVEALRMAVFSLAANDTVASLAFSLALLGGFAALMFAGALIIASRRRTLPA